MLRGTSDYLFNDPWSGDWLPKSEYLERIDDRIGLSMMWGYRIGRLWEMLRRRPVRADTFRLMRKREMVETLP